MEAPGALGHHRGAPAVPGRHVAGEGDERRRERPLPQETEIREEHGPVEPHRVELLEPCRRLPVVRRELLIVGRLGGQALPAALGQVTQFGRRPRVLHLGQREAPSPPRQPRIAQVVVEDGQRLLPTGRVDMVGPERAGLEEVLIRIDDIHHLLHSTTRQDLCLGEAAGQVSRASAFGSGGRASTGSGCHEGDCRYVHPVDDGRDRGSAANLAWWQEAAPLHAASGFYDLEGLRSGRDVMRPHEVAEIGEVSGRDLVHLQCHIGTDTVCLGSPGGPDRGS